MTITVTTAMPAKNDVVAVAEHLLALSGPMDPVRLHAMLYFSQANHLAMTGQRLFDNEIQAWAQGPVVASVHELHSGKDIIEPGSLRLARARYDNARLNRERVKALRAVAPRALALRTVRRSHLVADRAARLVGRPDGGLA